MVENLSVENIFPQLSRSTLPSMITAHNLSFVVYILLCLNGQKQITNNLTSNMHLSVSYKEKFQLSILSMPCEQNVYNHNHNEDQ